VEGGEGKGREWMERGERRKESEGRWPPFMDPKSPCWVITLTYYCYMSEKLCLWN